jgi:ABC-type Na+ transport system ATPase subunit NatA
MKKPDFDKLKKQASDIKQKATEMGSEAAKTAGGFRKGVETGVAVSKVALQKAGDILKKDNLTTGLDVAAKGTEIVGKTFEKASNQMKKFSNKLKQK